LKIDELLSIIGQNAKRIVRLRYYLWDRQKRDLIAYIGSNRTKLDQMAKVGNLIAALESLIEEKLSLKDN
jgi:beta-lactamase class A